MIYIKVKLLHTAFASISIIGFVLRGIWMLRESPLLQHRLSKTLPHINDTLLLLAGIWMIALLSLNPFTQPWLVAKFSGLIAYIVLGSIALKRGKTRPVKTIAFIAAIAVYAYITGVALSKSPLSWLAL
jgi:uncharacterized membrane protein SirB2